MDAAIVRYPPVVLLALSIGLTLLSACRTPDCETLPAGAERDGCLHGEASAAAKAGDIQKAYTAIRAIEGPVARAAAIDAVVATAPTQVDGKSVESLCATLPKPFLTTCLTTWNRPHLWNDPSKRSN